MTGMRSSGDPGAGQEPHGPDEQPQADQHTERGGDEGDPHGALRGPGEGDGGVRAHLGGIDPPAVGEAVDERRFAQVGVAGHGVPTRGQALAQHHPVGLGGVGDRGVVGQARPSARCWWPAGSGPARAGRPACRCRHRRPVRRPAPAGPRRCPSPVPAWCAATCARRAPPPGPAHASRRSRSRGQGVADRAHQAHRHGRVAQAGQVGAARVRERGVGGELGPRGQAQLGDPHRRDGAGPAEPVLGGPLLDAVDGEPERGAGDRPTGDRHLHGGGGTPLPARPQVHLTQRPAWARVGRPRSGRSAWAPSAARRPPR